MVRYPRLRIDTSKLRKNTEVITGLANNSGMGVYGVTKASCGDPKVAEAMIQGGVSGLADSRIENIIKLKESGIELPMMLLRSPMASEVPAVVKSSDVSLNSEWSTIQDLSDEAVKTGRCHKIILMVEMGDLREGVMVEDLSPLIDRTLDLEGIDLHGLGMNLACFAGVIPTLDKIKSFEALVEEQEKNHGIEFKMVTGGNSGNIPLLIDEQRKGRIDNLRVGEGILLGLETAYREPINGTNQDAFILEAQVIEAKVKPSVPFGKITQNAYGETLEYDDLGDFRRMIIGLGRQDTILEDLSPLDDGLEMIGGSSDHMVLNDKTSSFKVGDIVEFIPSYGALVALFTSPYVQKIYI